MSDNNTGMFRCDVGYCPHRAEAKNLRAERDALKSDNERLTKERDKEADNFRRMRLTSDQIAERSRINLEDAEKARRERDEARRMYCEAQAEISDECGHPERDARYHALEIWPDQVDTLFPEDDGQ